MASHGLAFEIGLPPVLPQRVARRNPGKRGQHFDRQEPRRVTPFQWASLVVSYFEGTPARFPAGLGHAGI